MKTDKLVKEEHFLLSISYTTENVNGADSTDHFIEKANTAYFMNLIRIALADDVISTKELDLLYQVSKRLGYTVEETDHLIRTTGKSDAPPPSGIRPRFDQVFEIVNMTLVNGVINKDEMDLASSFAAKCGFNEKEIPALLVQLLNGIRQGKNKEELFKEFQAQGIK